MACTCDKYPFTKFLSEFNTLTELPEKFLDTQNEVAGNFKSLTKLLYDFTKQEERFLPESEALPELIIQNFDEEQIWQEIELQNKACTSHLLPKVTKSLLNSDCSLLGLTISSPIQGYEDSNVEETNDELEISCDVKNSNSTKKENLREKNVQPQKKLKNKTSVVDDKFFKLAELDEFLKQEDHRENKLKKNLSESSDSDSEDVDLFAEIPSDIELDAEDCDAVCDNKDEVSSRKGSKGARFAKYEDFFDPLESDEDGQLCSSKSGTDEEDENAEDYDTRDADISDVISDHRGSANQLELASDSGSDEEDMKKILKQSEEKSTYEKKQEKLQKKIKELEESNLAEKPWQLQGEVAAEGRPENSILEEHLLFEHTSRPAPVITEETTKKLEDIIKQRIKEQIWDDVEKKQKPKEEPFEYRRRVTLDQEKSKASLAEIYEQEYIKQQQREKEEEEPSEHQEIRKMMTSLFAKLDALSNFHYTPKPRKPELKIISNLPAVTVEEVAPTAVSDLTLLAPEEVKAKPKGEVKSTTEKTSTDRKRDRRQKKLKQRQRRLDKESREKAVAKANPGLGNKYSKLEALKKLKHEKDVTLLEESRNKNSKDLKSSKKFFEKLQDQVSNHIQSKVKKKKKIKLKSANAVKLKL